MPWWESFLPAFLIGSGMLAVLVWTWTEIGNLANDAHLVRSVLVGALLVVGGPVSLAWALWRLAHEGE